MAKSVFEKYEADKAAKEAAEDVAEYTKNKNKRNAAIDGLEVFGANLKALKAASLYGDDQQKVIKEMRDELTKYENKIAADVMPALKKALEIAEPAIEEYQKNSVAIEVLYKDAKLNGGRPIAWKIGNINKTINNLIEQIKTE